MSATRVGLNLLAAHGDTILRRTQAALIAGAGSPIASAEAAASGSVMALVAMGIFVPFALPLIPFVALPVAAGEALKGALRGVLPGLKDAAGILRHGADYARYSYFSGWAGAKRK